MAIVSSLPVTHEEVNNLPLETLVHKVLELAHPDTQIQGQAGMQVNAFLSYAALALAQHVYDEMGK